MIEPLIRIFLRWFAIPFLLWLGLPEETLAELLADEDLRFLAMTMLPIVVTTVEGWWLYARNKGRAT